MAWFIRYFWTWTMFILCPHVRIFIVFIWYCCNWFNHSILAPDGNIYPQYFFFYRCVIWITLSINELSKFFIPPFLSNPLIFVTKSVIVIFKTNARASTKMKKFSKTCMSSIIFSTITDLRQDHKHQKNTNNEITSQTIT